MNNAIEWQMRWKSPGGRWWCGSVHTTERKAKTAAKAWLITHPRGCAMVAKVVATEVIKGNRFGRRWPSFRTDHQPPQAGKEKNP